MRMRGATVQLLYVCFNRISFFVSILGSRHHSMLVLDLVHDFLPDRLN